MRIALIQADTQAQLTQSQDGPWKPGGIRATMVKTGYFTSIIPEARTDVTDAANIKKFVATEPSTKLRLHHVQSDENTIFHWKRPREAPPQQQLRNCSITHADIHARLLSAEMRAGEALVLRIKGANNENGKQYWAFTGWR